MFFKQMILGAGVGYVMGLTMHKIINWIKLEFEGLYSVLLITLVLFTFSFSEFIGGNAFLAVYISACILGNSDFIHKKSLIKHFDATIMDDADYYVYHTGSAGLPETDSALSGYWYLSLISVNLSGTTLKRIYITGLF